MEILPSSSLSSTSARVNDLIVQSIKALNLEKYRLPPCIKNKVAIFLSRVYKYSENLDIVIQIYLRLIHSGILMASRYYWPRNRYKKSLTFCNLKNFHNVMESLREIPVILVGVDGGGNKCRVSVETYHGILLGGSCVKRPSHISFGDKTWENIIEGVTKILSAFEIPLESKRISFHGCFGLAGCSVPEYVNKFMTSSYVKLFTTLSITKDSEIAQIAAHNLGNGGIIIIGTGSAAFARYNENVYISGGRGFPLGDGGSGAYIGLKAAKALIKAFDNEEPWTNLTKDLADIFEGKVTSLIEWAKKANPTDFSKLAPPVAKHAKKDRVAQKIIKQAAQKIVELYENVIKKIDTPDARKIPFSLLGGLADTIKPFLPKEMIKVVALPMYSPAKGAVLLARKSSNI